MDRRIAFLREHRLVWAVSVSTLLHLLLALLFSRQGPFFILRLPEGSEDSADRRIAFEIVETPDDARSDVAPEDARLLSDKNAAARDLETARGAEGDMPYSQGDVAVKSIPGAGGGGGEASPSRSTSEASDAADPSNGDIGYRVESYAEGSRFSKDLLLGKTENAGAGSRQPTYDQTDVSAEDVGGISFNTYDWDFAPYLLELKRRIQRNIYPPPAFTQLGFTGNNILRFRIYPDGRLERLQVLGYQGEKALVETSRKAVQFSAPFWPLPADFPEAYLQVTAKFDYFIIRRK